VNQILELKNITKRFPGVVANDRISLDVAEGEIHALVGENGSGKSTLMNILYGLYEGDEGEIYVRGEKREISEPRDAINLRIGMVFQHFMLVETLTVAENVILGSEIRQGVRVNYRRAVQEVERLSQEYGLRVDPHAKIADISVGQQQRVEILKALYRGAEILILDEPTAVLTPQEVEELVRVMANLKAQGTTIIFITHKIKEVLVASDRVTVLRRGKKVGTKVTAKTNEPELAEMMVGRSVLLRVEKTPAEPQSAVFAAENLAVEDERGSLRVKGIGLEVRAGEVLGIAGVEGNGQSQLVEAIAGLMPVKQGRLFLNGQDITRATPLQRKRKGLGYVPEDRQRRGLILEYTVADNLVLGLHGEPPFVRYRFLRHDRAIQRNAEELVESYDIRPPQPNYLAQSLSGGNQQKVVVAREFTRTPKLLVCAQPTRGVDVGAIEFIHQQIIAQRDRGVAVLLVSAELDEILSLSDRIAVMYNGEIAAAMEARDATEKKLGFIMLGGRPEDFREEREEGVLDEV